jgi:hypothetical protein
MNQDQDADTRSPLTPLVKVLCKEIDMFLLFALNSLKQHSVLTTKRLWSVIDDLELQHENDLKDWDIFSLMLASTIIPEKNATSVELAESDKPLSPIQQQQEIELVPIQQQEEEIETLSTPLADLPAQHLSSDGDNVIQKEDVNIGVTTRPSLLEWDPFFGQKTLPIPFPRSAAADTSNYDDLKGKFYNSGVLEFCIDALLSRSFSSISRGEKLLQSMRQKVQEQKKLRSSLIKSAQHVLLFLR